MTDEPQGLARGPHELWRPDFSVYLRRSFAASMGYSQEVLDRPSSASPTASGLQQLPPEFPELIEAVKRGVLLGGGLPLEFPDNLAGRGVPQPHQPQVPQPDGDGHRGDDPRPADGCGGADGRLRQDGAGTADGRGLGRPSGDPARHRPDDDRATAASGWAPAPTAAASGGKYRAGEVVGRRDRRHRGPPGHHGRHLRRDGHGLDHGLHCRDAGHDACRAPLQFPRCTPTGCAPPRRPGGRGRMLRPDPPEPIITEKSVENALRVLLALGGSTNAIIHLTAIAGRLGIKVSLKRLNALSTKRRCW
jgi:dihydroxy-acid dehydratase